MKQGILAELKPTSDILLRAENPHEERTSKGWRPCVFEIKCRTVRQIYPNTVEP
jgi:hypothetical protein